MNRKEAEERIGQRVSCWTSANGIYAGTLARVVAEKGRPWRGVVRIDGILQAAQHFEGGKACRRGFRVGEEIEVGGVNIAPTDVAGMTSYIDILRAESDRMNELLKGADSRHAWALRGQAAACEAAIVCERERLAGTEWSWRRLQEVFLSISRPAPP